MYGGACMSELEATLTRLSHEFAAAVVAALRQLPVETLFEEVELPRATTRAAKAKIEAEPAPAPAQSDTEVSILEHLNEAGPTGSTVRAWVISTQGELPPEEHAQLEDEANGVLAALESRGLVQKRAFSKSRGQVYALAPV